ncbi:MAG TPA: hypothetical protein PK668_12790 [Myxococcota bacterium]|nr:hypothetical protein [Myxococcota bacterium]HRY93653.1 hypothetical protein [Myxococcota bacterium]HSA20986.1 hypothetical protein [Myxococcota bacterium]
MTTPVPAGELAAAAEIRGAAARYLAETRDQPPPGVPPDFLPHLPREVGEPARDADGRWRLGRWTLVREGDRSRLESYPPGGINAAHRVWFLLQLERRDGAWQVLPPGVQFVHAWAKGQR